MSDEYDSTLDGWTECFTSFIRAHSAMSAASVFALSVELRGLVCGVYGGTPEEVGREALAAAYADRDRFAERADRLHAEISRLRAQGEEPSHAVNFLEGRVAELEAELSRLRAEREGGREILFHDPDDGGHPFISGEGRLPDWRPDARGGMVVGPFYTAPPPPFDLDALERECSSGEIWDGDTISRMFSFLRGRLAQPAAVTCPPAEVDGVKGFDCSAPLAEPRRSSVERIVEALGRRMEGEIEPSGVEFALRETAETLSLVAGLDWSERVDAAARHLAIAAHHLWRECQRLEGERACDEAGGAA